ncbi:hypothetical protein JCM6882_009684 [Rhodosporidiobolus microsporus]
MPSTEAISSALEARLPHSVGPETAAKPPRAPLRMRHPEIGEAPDSDSEHDDTDGEGETTAVDDGSYADDNHVRKVLAREKPLPPITLANLHKNINVISTLAIAIVPCVAIYGALTTELKWQTAVWSVLYYFYTGLARLLISRLILFPFHLVLAGRASSPALPDDRASTYRTPALPSDEGGELDLGAVKLIFLTRRATVVLS